MTDIEQVSDWALSIAAEAAGSKLHHYERMSDDNRLAQSIEAHARAIEQHEAFRQEVSDAVAKFKASGTWDNWDDIARFIIAKPVDPFVALVGEAVWNDPNEPDAVDCAASILAGLKACGLEIREVD